MAERTVSVKLQAEVGSYIASMSKASAATMRLGESAGSAGNASKSAFDLAGKGPLLFGAAAVAGLGMAISASMDFEKSMSAVQAATHATASDLEDLRSAAMKAGADTAYSATEAADAITELSKAGVSTADIMGGGLTGALSLAAAGQLDVADAAGIAAVAMTQFHLAGEDLPHVADLLAAGAGKAMGSVDDLGQALNQAGLIASAAGWSIEETTGVLAAFASAGLIGSDAGTSLKTMLQRLQNPSAEAATKMKEFGISLYDASGNIVDADALAGQLATGLGGLTPAARDAAMAIIFGSDAVRGANVLYANGASGIADWTDRVNDAGYAADTAAALQDNLSGDLEKLKGSFETLMISIGSGAQGPLRDLVQLLGGVVDGVTWAVDAFTSLPGPLQAAIIAFVAFKALKGPLDDVFGSIVGGLMKAEIRMGTAISSAGGLKSALGGMVGSMTGWGAALAVGTVVLDAWSNAQQKSARFAAATEGRIRTLTDALHESNGAVTESIELQQATNAQDNGLAEWAGKAGVSLTDLTAALTGNDDALSGVVSTINESGIPGAALLSIAVQNAAGEFDTAATNADALGVVVDDTAGAMSGAAADTGSLTDSMALLGDTTGWTDEQISTAQDSLKSWRDNAQSILASFTDPLAIYTQQMQDAATAVANSTEDSSDSWSDYIDSVDFDLDAYATSLEEQNARQEQWRHDIVDITSRGGQEIGDILFNMGERGSGLVAAMVNMNSEEFDRMKNDMITDARFAGEGAVRELQAQMVAMAIVGASGGQATVQGLAAQLGLGADVIRGIASQYGINLAEGVNPVLQALGQLSVTVPQMGIGYDVRQPFGPGLQGHAEGGYTGNGGKYEPAGIVHRGEYVLTKEQTSRLGINEIERFANQGYANGGFVTAASVPRPYSTAPYGSPLSTAGDAAMQKEYTATTGWMNYLAAVAAAAAAAQGGVLGTGAVSGGWGSIWNWIKARVPQARINSTYRPGDPGYHGKNKAVDLGFGSGPGGNGSAGLALIKRTLYEGIGGSLAELIYDGVPSAGVPDLKNSASHTYNAATQAEHHNHVHAAVYDDGGLASGAGYLAKATVAPERVLSPRQTAAFEQWMTGREFSGGGGGAAANVVVNARVFVGNQEITDIARVEAEGVVVAALGSAVNRGNYNGA